MIGTLRAELRKLFTIRSTYAAMLLAVAVLGLFCFYVEGLRGQDTVVNPFKLSGIITNIASTVTICAAIVAILLVTHEYRYNTIMHTLTLSKSRLRVLVAKFLVVSGFVVVFTLGAIAVGLIFTQVGLAIAGLDLAPQTIYYRDLLWRVLLYAWVNSMFALLIAALIRNQVGSIAAYFVLPSTLEPLLGLLLKSNAVYLPFNMLGSILSPQGAVMMVNGKEQYLSNAKAVVLLLIYVAIGWLIAAVLFVRRDAN